jgi:pimeloyl-ACP methyl ester carboxylesterase
MPKHNGKTTMRWMHATLLVTALGAAALAAGCASSADTGAIALREVRGYHLGGKEISLSGIAVKNVKIIPGTAADPNGDYAVGQLYVQEFRLAAPKAKYPLMLWHGGGLTGVTWETTPDGRPGWEMFFLKQGHDVFVPDAYERGRASWPKVPELVEGEPQHRNLNQAWDLFRFGPPGSYQTDPAKRVAFAGEQFPVAFADQFNKQFVARWAGKQADDRAQAAYNALVDKACPCVLLAHSQGNVFAFNAELANPGKIKAVISIEPRGAPDISKTDMKTIAGIPHLAIWGDNIDQSKSWVAFRSESASYFDALRRAGGDAEIIDLPRMGIHGNSHMTMMDLNSDRIAGLVQDWMARKGLMKN